MNELNILKKIFPELEIVEHGDKIYSVYELKRFICWIDISLYDLDNDNSLTILEKNIRNKVNITWVKNYTKLIIVLNDNTETINSVFKYIEKDSKLIVFNNNRTKINNAVLKNNIEVSLKSSIDETLKYYSICFYPTITEYIIFQENMIISPTFFASTSLLFNNYTRIIFDKYEYVNENENYEIKTGFNNKIICIKRILYRRYGSSIDYFQTKRENKYYYSTEKILLINPDFKTLKDEEVVKIPSINMDYYDNVIQENIDNYKLNSSSSSTIQTIDKIYEDKINTVKFIENKTFQDQEYLKKYENDLQEKSLAELNSKVYDFKFIENKTFPDLSLLTYVSENNIQENNNIIPEKINSIETQKTHSNKKLLKATNNVGELKFQLQTDIKQLLAGKTKKEKLNFLIGNSAFFS